jgi:hypothetical protein
LISKLEDLTTDLTMSGDSERGLLVNEPVDYRKTVVLYADRGLAGTLCGKLEAGENGGPFGFCGGVGICASYITVRTAAIGGEEDIGCAG